MPAAGYPDARAVEAAIKAAAKNIHAADPTRQTGDLIRQAYYDRFLCRVFSDAEDSEWVLKGGTGMLARIPTARRTLDADLYRAGYDKDQALADLRRLAGLDLGDHFRFVYREHHDILTDDTQPYADGYRVTFDAYLGVKLVDTIKIDLSTGTRPTENLAIEEPANRLALPRLTSYP
ncbi:MAG: nucleotidyl transferase AbiEii/AbiGii toxin family protein, partial [Propionicimonas sp.]|nr:nucleotidyl transferase AbiEii/AbiGii toxin family protein [Propionicimonas sp.]